MKYYEIVNSKKSIEFLPNEKIKINHFTTTCAYLIATSFPVPCCTGPVAPKLPLKTLTQMEQGRFTSGKHCLMSFSLDSRTLRLPSEIQESLCSVATSVPHCTELSAPSRTTGCTRNGRTHAHIFSNNEQSERHMFFWSATKLS